MQLYDIQIPAGEGSAQIARLRGYIQDFLPKLAINIRPLILILPGGAYAYKSERESEPIAYAFLAKGYHVAILDYSTAQYEGPSDAQGTDFRVDPEARMQVAQSIRCIRDHAKEWNVDPERIFLWGASAGGHLAAHYACTWYDELPELTGLSREDLRIAGLLLNYPVITSGEHTNRKSITNLLREKAEDPAELRRVSLEKRVNEHMPPVFLWATWTDGSVPVENSLLFASALREHGINTELHIFSEGCHGLALADERTMGHEGKENVPRVSIWFDLACAWLKRMTQENE